MDRLELAVRCVRFMKTLGDAVADVRSLLLSMDTISLLLLQANPAAKAGLFVSGAALRVSLHRYFGNAS